MTKISPDKVFPLRSSLILQVIGKHYIQITFGYKSFLARKATAKLNILNIFLHLFTNFTLLYNILKSASFIMLKGWAFIQRLGSSFKWRLSNNLITKVAALSMGLILKGALNKGIPIRHFKVIVVKFRSEK